MHELLLQIIFYCFSALTVLCAVMVITQNNPVRCVLSLVVAFLSSAVLWLLLQAEFLALILVLVYVGAVMTLFLFVVMMLNIDIESMKTQFLKYVPFGLVLVAALTSFLLLVLPNTAYRQDVETLQTVNQELATGIMASNTDVMKKSNTERLGAVLYTDYVLAFELAAAILLVAIIAAISLVHRKPVRSKTQDVVRQIMTRRDERVQLIKMKSENK